ncbi:MAG: VOC family protein [Betaproteobacteria bacterium]|jgi:predicted enzyme related to lactoylglutathione lyase
MAEGTGPKAGTIAWHDLTASDAGKLGEFYAAVVGWRAEPVDMHGYADYNMLAPATGEPVAGVCHARGPNAGLPAQWLIYVLVESLEASLRACVERGGRIVDGPRGMGEQVFAVIRDPAGAHLALIGPPRK